MSNPTTRVFIKSKNLTSIDSDTMSLTQAVIFDASSNLIREIPEEISKFEALNTLRVFSNVIERLPRGISSCKKLKIVEIGKNRFFEFPPPLCLMPWITEICCEWNHIKKLPDKIGQIESLTTLNLNTNRLTDLPEAFSNLKSLTSLDLSINDFEVIPECIEKLSSLSSLNMAANKLTSIPSFIGNIKTLTKLDLRSNKIQSIPAEVCGLSKLTNLPMENNLLRHLPEEIGQLTALREFSFSHNKLVDIPESIGNLGSCKRIQLWKNELKTLPESIGAMKSLTEMDVSSNFIVELPKSLKDSTTLITNDLSLSDNRICGNLDGIFNEYPELRCLSLSRNGITGITADSSEDSPLCDRMNMLDLSFNNLTAIPDAIGKFKLLRKLNLAFNQMEEFPACICKCTAIQSILIGYNKITDIPKEISALKDLSELNASGNSFTQFPKSVIAIPSIKQIILSNNSISSIPSEITSIKTLKTLDLSSNNISSLDVLCANSSLTDINLSNNKITTLPPALAQVKCLVDFDVSRNRIREVPWNPRIFPKLRSFNIAHNDIKLPDNSRIPPQFAPGEYSSGVVKFEGNNLLDRYFIGRTERSEPEARIPFSVYIGWSEMCGRRPDMQDSLCVHQYFQHVPWQHLVGVFDGHSGSLSAMYCASSLAPLLSDALESGAQVQKALRQTFQTLHREVEMYDFKDGSAAIVALIQGASLYVANSGDSRAVICRSGVAVDLSFDHKPDNEAENKRIRDLGGFVSINKRVSGELALSRSIGDCAYQPFVTWKPEITVTQLEPTDEFIIMGCDGIWDVFTSQQAVDIVRGIHDPIKAATLLRDCAYSRGSADNLSAIVIRFSKS